MKKAVATRSGLLFFRQAIDYEANRPIFFPVSFDILF